MKSFVLLIALFAGVAAGSLAQDTCNPRPCPDDLVLPMPNGLRMVFRPVYLNVGAGPLAVREIILGGRADEGFRENPTKVAIGGSFLGKNAGKPDWLFFLGKYEVTEEQFATVIPSSARVGPQEARPRGSLPKVDVTRWRSRIFCKATICGCLPTHGTLFQRQMVNPDLFGFPPKWNGSLPPGVGPP
jgi:hypothetical protein